VWQRPRGAATKACRTATSPPDRGTGGAGGKAQVNTAALRPAQAGGVCRQRAGWGGPRGPWERKSSVQHIQICPRHRWEGQARQKASSSSCPAGRWRDSSSSFQQGGPGGPQTYRDTQIHRWQLRYPGRVAGVQGAQNPRRGQEDREDRCREERPVTALMLPSTVGYLQEEKTGSTVVTLLGLALQHT